MISPNRESRQGHEIDMIVLHSTVGSFTSAVSWLCSTSSRASAHYIIGRDGTIANIVPESDAAWHCGTTQLDNLRSIGIELVDDRITDISWMTDQQYVKLMILVSQICDRFHIPVDREHIKMHKEIKAKGDPVGWYGETMIKFINDVFNHLNPEDEDMIDYKEMEQATFQAMAKAKGAEVRGEWIKKNPGKNIYDEFCKKYFFRDANGGLTYKTATAATWINDMATFYSLGGVDGQWTQL